VLQAIPNVSESFEMDGGASILNFPNILDMINFRHVEEGLYLGLPDVKIAKGGRFESSAKIEM
jgi:hypothetical protein